jgi:hypothetical protein
MEAKNCLLNVISIPYDRDFNIAVYSYNISYKGNESLCNAKQTFTSVMSKN